MSKIEDLSDMIKRLHKELSEKSKSQLKDEVYVINSYDLYLILNASLYLYEKEADLEAKLAESNESHHKNIVELTKIATEKDRKIAELKQQLAEKEAEISKLQTFNKSLNGIKEDMRKRLDLIRTSSKKDYIRNMEQQLAEKDEEHMKAMQNALNDFLTLRQELNQDKISFAVEKLENVKEYLTQELENVTELLDPLEYEDYHEFIGCGRGYKNSIEEIDNQIKQLKKEMK